MKLKLPGLSWLCLAVAGTCAAAPVPVTEYGWRFPLHLDAGADVHVLTLTPDVYRSSSTVDLRDLRLVTAAGEEVSFGQLAVPQVDRWRDMPWALQRTGLVFEPMPSLEMGEIAQPRTPSRDGDFGLTLARGEYAARMSMRVTSNAVETVPIVVLRIVWSARAALPQTTRWWISDPDSGDPIYPESSNQRYDASTASGETRLVFRGIEAHTFDLHAQAVPSSLYVEHIHAEYVPDPQQYRHSVDAAAFEYPQQPEDAYGFIVDGAFPVHAAEIELADGGIASVRLLARDMWTPQWQEIGNTTAFDLTIDNTALLRNRIHFQPTRQRQWLLRSAPALAHAPKLRLYYEPDRFLIAHSGGADLYLMAGHRTALRPDYPVQALMSELHQRFGDRWAPQAATLGAREEIRGREALLTPPPPPPYRKWLLWALLVLAAAVVALMALSLLKEDRAAAAADTPRDP